LIKLVSNYTNGELDIDRKIKTDITLETPIFLSLFGGNKEADTKSARNPAGVDNLDWFGNVFQQSKGKSLFNSSFERKTMELSLTSGNIKEFERSIIEDLNWMIIQGIADEIKSSVSITGRDTLSITIEIIKNKKTINKYNYLYEVTQ